MRLRDSIIARIPEHHTYIELFAGAAWVYFGKDPSKVEVINDINSDLVNLYQTIKDSPQEFLDTLWYMFPSRHLYHEAKRILDQDKEQQSLCSVERAVLFYYHIKNAFGARYGSGYRFSKNIPPREVIGLDTLVALRDRLSNTYVENLPFERIIKNYDTDRSFFYCDPPYHVADGTDYYQFVFDEAQHTLLRDKLAGAKGKWLISYDDTPFIRQLYKGYKIQKTAPVAYTLNNKKRPEGLLRKQELLISNY